MATRDDCFYFITSNCARNETCSYRHNETAKNAGIVCPKWKNKIECTDDCPMLHSEYGNSAAAAKPNLSKSIPCYWESRGGCKKSDCPFVHTAQQSSISLLDIAQLDFYTVKDVENHHGDVVIKSMDQLVNEIREINRMFYHQ